MTVVEPRLFAPSCPPRVDPLRPAHDRGLPRAHTATIAAWSGMNGRQGGDRPGSPTPHRPGDHEQPPVRWVAGADAVAGVEQKAKDLLAQVDAHRDLSSRLAHDGAVAPPLPPDPPAKDPAAPSRLPSRTAPER